MNAGRMARVGETALGRPGVDLQSTVWPTPEVRLVAVQKFHPFSGDPQIRVEAIAPEIQERPNAKIVAITKRSTPYSCEVLFDLDDVLFAELFATKALIVLASLHLEKACVTREEFYARALRLCDNDIRHGLLPKGKRTTTTPTHVAEKLTPRRSF